MLGVVENNLSVKCWGLRRGSELLVVESIELYRKSRSVGCDLEIVDGREEKRFHDRDKRSRDEKETVALASTAPFVPSH